MSLPTVYKPAVTRPLPTGAELFEQEGQPFARWRDSHGHIHTAPVTVVEKGSCAGQTRVVIESDRYVIRYQDEAGVIRTVNTDFRSEEDARRLLDQLVQQVEAARKAKIPPLGTTKPPDAPRALRDHFQEYVQFLKTHDTPPVRIADIERQVRRIARQCRFLRLSEINADAVEQWLADRETDGMPAATRNAHLDDLMDFVEWCLRERRLPKNPISGIKSSAGPKESLPPQARPLTEKELERLLRIALWRPLAEYGRAVPQESSSGASPPCFTPLTIDTLDELVVRGRQQFKDKPGQIARLRRQGWQRAIIYKTLALTGLRRSEMVSLKTGMVRLKRRSPVLRVGAKADDESAGSVIPLRADLAADLKLWLRYRWRFVRKKTLKENRDALRKAFLLKPLFKLPAGLAKQLAIDLQAAGIHQVDQKGIRIDVHAARLTRETLFVSKGVQIVALWPSVKDDLDESTTARVLKQGLLKVFKPRGRKNHQAD